MMTIISPGKSHKNLTMTVAGNKYKGTEIYESIYECNICILLAWHGHRNSKYSLDVKEITHCRFFIGLK